MTKKVTCEDRSCNKLEHNHEWTGRKICEHCNNNTFRVKDDIGSTTYYCDRCNDKTIVFDQNYEG